MDTGGIAAERLYSFIRRIERLQDELDGLNDDKGEVFKEAKQAGFDTNIMKAQIKRRRNGKGATEEADALLAIYEQAVENAESDKPGSSSGRTSRAREDGPSPPEPTTH